MFLAKFESMCPYCYCTIRNGDKCEYVKNIVYHERCSKQVKTENDKAIDAHKEREGYL